MDASLLSPPTLAVAAVCLAIGWVAHAAAAAPAAAASGASALLDDADSDQEDDAQIVLFIPVSIQKQSTELTLPQDPLALKGKHP